MQSDSYREGQTQGTDHGAGDYPRSIESIRDPTLTPVQHRGPRHECENQSDQDL